MAARAMTAGWAALALAVAMSVSCARLDTPEKKFSFLFSGYDLVEIRPLTAGSDPEHVFPLEVTTGRAVDRRWQPGRLYVFAPRTTESNERMALDVFPARIRKIGGTIVRAPRSILDMIQLFIGGPLFRIEFTIADRRGVILNRIGKIDGEPTELLMFVYT